MSSLNNVSSNLQSITYSPKFSNNSNKISCNVIATDRVQSQLLDEVPLKNKETFLSSQLAILSEENEMIRENLTNLDKGNFYNEDIAMEEEILLNELLEFKRYRKEMELKLQNFENRVKHMSNKNETIVKEITQIGSKTTRLKEVKRFKNDHENVVIKAKEDKSLAIKLKKDRINKDNYYRDQNNRNLKINNAKNKSQNQQVEVREKEKNTELKEKMELYEKILYENKRLRSAYKTKKLEVGREGFELKQKEEKAKKIKEQLYKEKETSTFIDQKMNNLQKQEEKLVEQLSYSMTKRNQVKNRLTEIASGMNNNNSLKDEVDDHS